MVVLVARRRVLVAFNRQVSQLPVALQRRECGLVEIGRQHARNFDAGHFPSGGGMQRVLTELRRLAAGCAHRPWPPARRRTIRPTQPSEDAALGKAVISQQPSSGPAVPHARPAPGTA